MSEEQDGLGLGALEEAIASYGPPVDQLLMLGDLREGPKWDYLSLGLRAEDVPELVRMAGDQVLHDASGEYEAVWAPVHAWRALGDLGATEAIAPLVALFELPEAKEDYDEWVSQDLPNTLVHFGAAAVPALTRYLHDPERWVWGRASAAQALNLIAQQDDSQRAGVVNALSAVLTAAAQTGGADQVREEDTLNGLVIDDLIELRAVEAIEAIRQAYAADVVDQAQVGTLEMVEAALGLRAVPEGGWPPLPFAEFGDDFDIDSFALGDEAYYSDDDDGSGEPWGGGTPLPRVKLQAKDAPQKAKSRRKMAKQSQKQNRKRKK